MVHLLFVWTLLHELELECFFFSGVGRSVKSVALIGQVMSV